MSASQFDDLLGDFGDSTTTTTTTTTTTKTSSNGAFDDDFDPFGPSSEQAPTANGGDSGLLLDFSASSEIKNGESSNGIDLQFEATSSDSANPLYDMSADTQSSNPLYDLSSGGSGNPLYDMSSEGDVNQSSNPLYEFSAETTSSSEPTNPLYDFENAGTTDDAPQEVDLLSGTNQQYEEEEEQQQQTEPQSSYGDLLGDFEDQNDGEGRQDVEIEDLQEYKPVVMNGDPKDWVRQDSPTAEVEEEEEAEEQLEDYAERVEVEEEEEEVVEDGRTVSRTSRTETSRYSGSGFEDTQTSDAYSSRQWEEERNRQNADLDRQAAEKDIVHFSEMSSVKDKFESQPTAAPRKQVDIQQEVLSAEGGVYESQPQAFEQWQNEEEEEEGIYENQPTKREDVVREADTDRTKDLPAVGTASNIKAKWMSQAHQEYTSRSKREITPPAHGAGGEYVSEPRGYVERYEGKADSGVFESQPQYNPDVVTSTPVVEDVSVQQGYAKNTAAKFKEMQSQQYTPSAKREITPDRSGRVEYVSEPRGTFERYEGKAESGVFESEPAMNPDVVRSGEGSVEQLPERGTAKNLASRFHQISSESSTYSSSSRAKREITPDRSGRVEYVSEPRGQSETYEVRVDAGVYENQPVRNADVITSDSVTEEYVPEKGYARNVAAKFKELESTAKSPPLSPGRRKEFTPPREEERIKQSVVLENNPDYKDDVVHSTDHLEEALPERGTAKNIAQRFKQMEAESRSPGSPRARKEITPPREANAGVYENQPQQFQADYNRPAESGIIENQPIKRDDLIRGDEPPRYEEELPERGAAKNLVSKWRQIESESAKARSPGSGGRVKEFTPPREEPRIAEQRKSPRTPLSPAEHGSMDNGSVHPMDLPGQYQPLDEPSVFESNPEYRYGVAREGDTDWAAGLPKKDTAKKMMARFQRIQAEANKEAPAPVRKVGRSKSMRAAIQTEKCGACEKTVYAMERLEMNKRVYHKACFRCTQCKAVLTPKTFAINNEVIFCTTHYKQLFATKGNYDEGFGRMQHKKRWSSNPNLAAKDDEESNQQQSTAVKS